MPWPSANAAVETTAIAHGETANPVDTAPTTAARKRNSSKAAMTGRTAPSRTAHPAVESGASSSRSPSLLSTPARSSADAATSLAP
jgi:hypothetical protein